MIGEKGNKDAAEKLAKEQELSKIHVKKEDIEVMVSNDCCIQISLSICPLIYLFQFVCLFVFVH